MRPLRWFVRFMEREKRTRSRMNHERTGNNVGNGIWRQMLATPFSGVSRPPIRDEFIEFASLSVLYRECNGRFSIDTVAYRFVPRFQLFPFSRKSSLVNSGGNHLLRFPFSWHSTVGLLEDYFSIKNLLPRRSNYFNTKMSSFTAVKLEEPTDPDQAPIKQSTNEAHAIIRTTVNNKCDSIFHFSRWTFPVVCLFFTLFFCVEQPGEASKIQLVKGPRYGGQQSQQWTAWWWRSWRRMW